MYIEAIVAQRHNRVAVKATGLAYRYRFIWARFLPEEIKYLIFSFLRSDKDKARR